MIVVQVSDPQLRRAVCLAAHPEEDAIVDAQLGAAALEWASPRLVVTDAGAMAMRVPLNRNHLELDRTMLRRWENERRAGDVPEPRADYFAARLAPIVRGSETQLTWADRTLANLERATGQKLPLSLRSFGRRVLEFPYHYRMLYPFALGCDTTVGALKAKFRRRDMSSPSMYLRWFRTLAVAEVLADRSVTVAAAARRLGFSSSGNLCRTMAHLTGTSPTQARSAAGRSRLVVSLAGSHLTPEELVAWASLDNLVQQRVA